MTSLRDLSVFLAVSFGAAYALDTYMYLAGLSRFFGIIATVRMFTPLMGVAAVALVNGKSVLGTLREHGLGFGKLLWIAPALLIPYAIYGLSVAYALALGLGIRNPGGELLPKVGSQLTALVDPNTATVALLAGGAVSGLTVNALAALGEEVGWRGYLLDALGAKLGAAFIGVVWALWHAPLILLFGYSYPHHPVLGIALYVALLVPLNVILIMLRLGSGGIYAPSVAHGTFNALGLTIALTIDVSDEAWGAPTGLIGIAAVATALIMFYPVYRLWGPRS